MTMIYYYFDDNAGEYRLDEDLIDLLAYQQLEKERQEIEKYYPQDYKTK